MAAEVHRVAAKGCHAVTFSENPEKLGYPELPRSTGGADKKSAIAIALFLVLSPLPRIRTIADEAALKVDADPGRVPSAGPQVVRDRLCTRAVDARQIPTRASRPISTPPSLGAPGEGRAGVSRRPGRDGCRRSDTGAGRRCRGPVAVGVGVGVGVAVGSVRLCVEREDRRVAQGRVVRAAHLVGEGVRTDVAGVRRVDDGAHGRGRCVGPLTIVGGPMSPRSFPLTSTVTAFPPSSMRRRRRQRAPPPRSLSRWRIGRSCRRRSR